MALDNRLQRFLLATIAIVGLSLAWDWLAWRSFDGFLGAFDFYATPFRDFQVVYYPTAKDVLTTHAPGSQFYYPPFFALLLSPLGRLSIDAATNIWIGVQIVAVAALVLVPAVYFLRQNLRLAMMCVVLTAFSQPVLHNFRWGQVSTPVTAVILLAVLLMETRGWSLSATLVAAATAVKIYPALFVLPAILQKRVRWLGVCALAGFVCLVAVPVLMLGLPATEAFYRTVSAQLTADAIAMRKNLNSEYLPNALMRVFFWDHPEEHWRPIFEGGAFFLLLMAAALVVRAQRSTLMTAVLIFLSIPLVIATSWPHYFVFLPFCQTVAWASVAGGKPARIVQRMLIGGSIVLGSTPFFRALGTDGFIFYAGNGFPVWSDLLVLAAVGWQVMEI